MPVIKRHLELCPFENGRHQSFKARKPASPSDVCGEDGVALIAAGSIAPSRRLAPSRKMTSWRSRPSVARAPIIQPFVQGDPIESGLKSGKLLFYNMSKSYKSFMCS